MIARIVARRDRVALEALLATVTYGSLTWRHEDGVISRFGIPGRSPCTVVRWSDRATRRTLGEGVIGFCDGWVQGDWSIDEGTLLGLMSSLVSARLNQALKRRAHAWIKARVAIGHVASQLTRARAHASVRAHYDLDTAFYGLWLDRNLVYTCGFARDAKDDLETMQAQKLDLVCRKLRLEPGMRLLDLGCGWGALAIHAAKKYDVRVTAVNISRPQLDWLSARVAEQHLENRVEIVCSDFRSVRGRFDRVAAIGIAEHVGKRRLRDLFRSIASHIDPHGLALVHTIASSTTGGTDPWLERAVFPGSYVPTLSELARHAESQSQRVLHVEDLGAHYALTMRHWLARFLAHRETARERYGEAFCRTWEMYLALLVPTFEFLSTGLFQVLIAGGEGLPEAANVEPWCGVCRVDELEQA